MFIQGRREGILLPISRPLNRRFCVPRRCPGEYFRLRVWPVGWLSRLYDYVLISRPLARSHSRNVPSQLGDSAVLPSGAMATDVTAHECPACGTIWALGPC
jgi:hypothetical protein